MTSLDIMFILVIAVNVWNKNVITWMTVLPSKVCPVANFQTTIIAWVPSGHNWLISTMLSPVECTLMTFDHPPFVSGDFQQHFFSHNPCLAVYGAHLIYFYHFLKHTPLGSMHGFRGYTSASIPGQKAAQTIKRQLRTAFTLISSDTCPTLTRMEKKIQPKNKKKLLFFPDGQKKIKIKVKTPILFSWRPL